MDTTITVIIMMVILVTVPVFFLVFKNKDRMKEVPDRNFDPNHRKRRKKRK